MPLTPAERQERLRKKRRDVGTVRYDLAVPCPLDRKLRDLAKKEKRPLSKVVLAFLEQVVG